MLVFLSGEREIHDTADALRRSTGQTSRCCRCTPGCRRPSSTASSSRIRGRRIVLSTNVAETSLTVPGVRYVVDAGTARISRYSRRLKVQRLPIEPVSQASANQRAGRCGRLAPGICIRLYGEDDFAARPEFTEPEILRTNLASVILQMTAIGLGDVAAFPFVEPPDSAASATATLLLEELGAIDAAGDADGVRPLTPIGRRLARLPVDPRLGRMVLEAERHGCVREVLVIAAALSIQDPRERPADERQQADARTAASTSPAPTCCRSSPCGTTCASEQRQRSSNQFRKLCRAEYLNYLRVREWQDLFSQLRQVAGDLGIRVDDRGRASRPRPPGGARRAAVAPRHSATATPREFRGARGAAFVIAPGSVLAKRPPRWVMAAELVETNRLWARRVAAIQPEWAERIGAHLVKRSYGEPRWDRRARPRRRHRDGDAVRPADRHRAHGRLRPGRPAAARELFIRHALVLGEWDADHRFLERNRRVRRRGRRARSPACDAATSSTTTPSTTSTTATSLPTSCRRGTSTGGGATPATTTPNCSSSPPTTCAIADGAAIRLDDYPGHVALRRRSTLPLTLSLRPRRAARRRHVARAAHRAQPGHRRAVSTGRSPATAASSSTRSCARCRRTSAAR